MRWRWRKNREQDLERELRSDLELETAEQQENGLSAEDAHYAAHRAFGNTTLVKEEVREMWQMDSIRTARTGSSLWHSDTAQKSRIYVGRSSDAGLGNWRQLSDVQRHLWRFAPSAAIS